MKKIVLRLAILPIVGFSFATCIRNSKTPTLEETLRENYGCIGIGHGENSNPQQREKEALKAALINYGVNCYDAVKDKDAVWDEVYDYSINTAYFYKVNKTKQ